MGKTDKPGIGIRVSSEPDLKEAKKSVELPLRVLLISDLLPSSPSPDDWAERTRIVRVDRTSFADLMASFAPRLTLDVTNHLSPTPKELELELVFTDLKAFRPEGLVEQIPPLKRLVRIRSLVEGVKTSTVPLSEFREQLLATGIDREWAEQLYQVLSAPEEPQRPQKAKPDGSTPSDGGKLEGLLGMVDFGQGEGAPPAKDGLDALIQAISGEPASTRAQKTAADVILEDLDGMIGGQLNAILHHPAFQGLEAAWRGFRFLVDRTDSRRNILLEVLPVRRKDLAEAFYHNVLMAEHNRAAGPPLSLIVADFSFGSTQDEITALEDLAESAASLQVPLVASATTAFFGLSDADSLPVLPVLWQHFQRPEYVPWNAFREKAISGFLTLAIPRFLLRSPYGTEAPVKGFAFVEENGSRDHHLWGNASVAVAAAVTQSFAKSSWPTHISGAGAMLESLPLWTHGVGRTPLEVLIGDDKSAECAASGIAVLSGRANHDGVFLRFAPTVQRPQKYEDRESDEEARMHATLACQLAVTRVAHHLLAMQREFAPGLSEAGLKREITERLHSLLRSSGAALRAEAIEVEIGESPSQPGRRAAGVRVTLPEQVLGQEIGVVLGLDITG